MPKDDEKTKTVEPLKITKKSVLGLEHPNDLECLEQIDEVELPDKAKNLLLAMVYTSNKFSQKVVAISDAYLIERIVQTGILGGRLMSGCLSNPNYLVSGLPKLIGYLILSQNNSPHHIQYGPLISVLIEKMRMGIDTIVTTLSPEPKEKGIPEENLPDIGGN